MDILNLVDTKKKITNMLIFLNYYYPKKAKNLFFAIYTNKKNFFFGTIADKFR